MNRRNVLVLAIVGVAMVIVLAGCGGTQKSNSGSGQNTQGGTGGGATVIEQGLAFEPATLEVGVGDTVTFRNEDSATHNVKIDGKELGDQGQGEEVTWKAEKTGAFPYNCVIHPSMTGEITVK